MRFIVDGTGVSIPLSVLTYNVNSAANAARPFHERADEIICMILHGTGERSPDVVLLQELRNDDRYPETGSIQDFLERLRKEGGYEYRWQQRNPTPLAFGQAILFKSNLFFCSETRNVWLGGTDLSDFPVDANPRGVGSLMLGCLLIPTGGQGRDTKLLFEHRVAVFNIHFPLAEEDKLLCASQLPRAINGCFRMNSFGGPRYAVVAGDANTFFDRDAETQLAATLVHSSINTTKLRLLTMDVDSSGRFCPRLVDDRYQPISGTFFGDDNDNFKQPLDSPSLLDHIWVSDRADGFVRPERVLAVPRVTVVRDAEGHAVRDQPSDHLPVRVELVLESLQQ